MSEPHWEKVYTVTDWYDGERLGLADYHGQPHLYESRWDLSVDEWEGEGDEENYLYHFWLSRVTPDVLALALEDWAIWQRWEAAFHAGKSYARHEQLQSLLGQALEPGQPGAFRMAGKFGRKLDALSVHWSHPRSQPAQQSLGGNDQAI